MITKPDREKATAEALGAHNIFWDEGSRAYIKVATQAWEKFLIEQDVLEGKCEGAEVHFERQGKEDGCGQRPSTQEESSMANEADFETDENFDSTYVVKKPSSTASDDLF